MQERHIEMLKNAEILDSPKGSIWKKSLFPIMVSSSSFSFFFFYISISISVLFWSLY